MEKINNLDIFSFNTTLENNEENKKKHPSTINHEKVLCNHCGRTSKNGIRCLGICVADNDY
tara:strand:- start:382 stop:564 length:183 start_codon:yes stop_codon:yes gene_type:complete